MSRNMQGFVLTLIFLTLFASCKSPLGNENQQSELTRYQALSGTRCEKIAKIAPPESESFIRQLCESPANILETLLSVFIKNTNSNDTHYQTNNSQMRIADLSKFLTSNQSGSGISIGANANLSSGLLLYEAELGYQNGELALFCSVGAGALVGLSAASAGATASMGLVKRVGCRDHNAYKGGFLSIGISSGVSAGLGVNGQVLLNFGVARLSELPALLSAKIHELNQKHRNKLHEQTLAELQIINRIFFVNHLPQDAPGIVLLVAFMRAIYEAQLAPYDRNVRSLVETLQPLTKKLILSLTQNKNSSDFIFNKAAIEHLASLQSFVLQTHQDMPVLNAAIEVLNEILTGCDAIGVSAGVGASLGTPITADYAIYYSFYSWPKHAAISMSDIRQYGEILSSPEESFKRKIGAVFRYTKSVADFVLLAKGLSNRSFYQKECVVPVTKELGSFYGKLGNRFVDSVGN